MWATGVFGRQPVVDRIAGVLDVGPVRSGLEEDVSVGGDVGADLFGQFHHGSAVADVPEEDVGDAVPAHALRVAVLALEAADLGGDGDVGYAIAVTRVAVLAELALGAGYVDELDGEVGGAVDGCLDGVCAGHVTPSDHDPIVDVVYYTELSQLVNTERRGRAVNCPARLLVDTSTASP